MKRLFSIIIMFVLAAAVMVAAEAEEYSVTPRNVSMK